MGTPRIATAGSGSEAASVVTSAPRNTTGAAPRPPRARRPRDNGPAGRSRIAPYLFLLPGMVLFGVFVIWPAASAVQIAFYKYNIIDPAVPVGWANFDRLLHSGEFWQVVRNSLVYLVGLVPFATILPLLLAVLVNRPLRGIKVFRAIYFLPVITSMVAVAVAWSFVFDDQGLLNWFFGMFGDHDSVHFLIDRAWAQPSVILVEGWKGMGTYMMILLAGLQSIPSDLYEAATVDGAGAWARLRYITLPMIRPFLAVALTLEMLGSMQVFTSVFMLTKGGPDNSTASLGYFIYSQAFEGHRMGYASAAALMMCVFLVLLSLLNYRLGRRND